MKTTMKTTTVNRMMMSALVPVIMYAHFNTVLPHVTPFQYSWFHIIFVLGAMYVAMLLTDWYEYHHCLSVSALITYTLYPGMSSVRVRHRLRPIVRTSTSGAPKRRCGCASSVRGSVCFYTYGVCLPRSSCPTGKLIAWSLGVTRAHFGCSFSDF